jgi:glycosyltransferase involved in cell wall biosynthesis
MKQIKNAGHDIIVSGYYGHRGAILQADDGIQILPGGLEEWGNDILAAHYRKYKPDVVVSLMDVWVLQREMVEQMPLTGWCPVDHDPVPPRVIESLIPFTWIWAMSRFGETQLKAATYTQAVYVPHGVDSEQFFPTDRDKARENWSIPGDTFLVLMNAANKGVPSRKSFESIIKAWSVFSKYHPNSILFMHTLPLPATYGLTITDLLNFYGVDSSTIRFPDMYNYVVGSYGSGALRELYNAADVFLAPSRGEGFGIPVVEAQMCGCPVIVSDFSSQTELCFDGYKIEFDYLDDYVWTNQQSEQVNVVPSKIIEGLEWALENVGNNKLRELAHEGAKDYDADYVFKKYMHPSLKYMAQRNKDFTVGGDVEDVYT